MDWSYIAGFFDGEGNIHFNKIGNKSYQLLCRSYSSNDKVLVEIKNFIGFGEIYTKKSTGLYELTICKKDENLTFLKAIYPFSIIKKEAIKFTLDNYKFDRSNNLDFNIQGFHNLITRKNVAKYYRENTR